MVRAKMKPKRKIEYTLRPLMKRVKVDAMPGGWLRVTPLWSSKIGFPGVMTLAAAASRLETLINRYLARRKLP